MAMRLFLVTALGLLLSAQAFGQKGGDSAPGAPGQQGPALDYFSRLADSVTGPGRCEDIELSDVGYLAGRAVYLASDYLDEEFERAMREMMFGYAYRHWPCLQDDESRTIALETGFTVGSEGLPPAAALVGNLAIQDGAIDEFVEMAADEFFEVHNAGGPGLQYMACTHPEWRDGMGFSHALVPTDVIEELGQGPGVNCTATDQIRRTSALRHVCGRPTFRSETWVEWVGGNEGVALLACP